MPMANLVIFKTSLKFMEEKMKAVFNPSVKLRLKGLSNQIDRHFIAQNVRNRNIVIYNYLYILYFKKVNTVNFFIRKYLWLAKM